MIARPSARPIAGGRGGAAARDGAAPDPRAPHRGATSGMIVATLLWGATFVVLRDSLARVTPVVLVFFRFSAAAVIFAVVLAVRRVRLDRAAVAGGTLAGLLGGAGYLFQAIGLTSTSAGTSAFITSAGTLMAGVFAWPLLGQRPSRVLAAGLVMALAGSLLLPARSDLRLGLGESWTMAGALAFALQVVAVARFAPRADPAALAGVQSLVVGACLAPFVATAGGSLAALKAAGWWRLGYLIVAGTVLAPLLQMMAQRTLSAGRIGLLFGLEPVFALGFAVTVGEERFATRWWWGAGLILGAVWLVEGLALRRAAASRSASG